MFGTQSSSYTWPRTAFISLQVTHWQPSNLSQVGGACQRMTAVRWSSSTYSSVVLPEGTRPGPKSPTTHIGMDRTIVRGAGVRVPSVW